MVDEDGWCVGECSCENWSRSYKHGAGTIPEVRTGQRVSVFWTAESAIEADFEVHRQARGLFDAPN
jgi:hypothetical protein